ARSTAARDSAPGRRSDPSQALLGLLGSVLGWSWVCMTLTIPGHPGPGPGTVRKSHQTAEDDYDPSAAGFGIERRRPRPVSVTDQPPIEAFPVWPRFTDTVASPSYASSGFGVPLFG